VCKRTVNTFAGFHRSRTDSREQSVERKFVGVERHRLAVDIFCKPALSMSALRNGVGVISRDPQSEDARFPENQFRPWRRNSAANGRAETAHTKHRQHCQFVGVFNAVFLIYPPAMSRENREQSSYEFIYRSCFISKCQKAHKPQVNIIQTAGSR